MAVVHKNEHNAASENSKVWLCLFANSSKSSTGNISSFEWALQTVSTLVWIER